ncbi:MAG: amidohydrolase family protein [Chloroflexi bacterium]|nr:amidohydrolase family protein [Chloroflexota bacterium]
MAAVIDFHVHLFSRGEYRPWIRDYAQRSLGMDFDQAIDQLMTPIRMRDLLREHGVDLGIGLAEQNPLVTGTCDNDYVARFCRECGVLIPFASVNPYVTADPALEVERAVRELGCKGLKLYPSYQHYYPNDAQVYPVYARSEKLGIPVMIHTGSTVFRGAKLRYADPLFLDDVAVDFPDLKIIQVHSGRGFWYDRAFFLSQLHKNMYMEISGLPPRNLLSYFPEFERNADKIIFGSDWPSTADIKGNIDGIKALPLTERTKDKILGENAAALLGL